MNGRTPSTESNMSYLPTPTLECPPEVLEAAETMSGLLREQAKYLKVLVGLVRDRLDANQLGDFARRQACLELEKEALLDFVLVERERIAMLRQIGLTLGHHRPSSLRIAELILYLSPDLRDELLDGRDEVRDLADELEALRARTPHFDHHQVGRVTLFLSPQVPATKSRQWIEPESDASRSVEWPGPRHHRPAGESYHHGEL